MKTISSRYTSDENSSLFASVSKSSKSRLVSCNIKIFGEIDADDMEEAELIMDEDDITDDEYGEYGDWYADEGEEVEDAISDDPDYTEEDEEDEEGAVPDMSAEFTAVLQTNGQLIYSDEYCQIRYFGETKDDEGNLTFVLGYSKFHGALVRINKASFVWGSAVDGSELWFSPMNSFDDGYWCHSGDHGDEFYDDPGDRWWNDNGFIYLRSPSSETAYELYFLENDEYVGYDSASYASYSKAAGEYTGYDDSVYDSVSCVNLHIGELEIQESVHMTGSETEPPYFEGSSDENTHKCEDSYSVSVIRVRFDPDKADVWAHT